MVVLRKSVVLTVNTWHFFTYWSIYFFNLNKEQPLKKSNKKTHISLFSNLFIYLIELKDQLKHQIKEHSCTGDFILDII